MENKLKTKTAVCSSTVRNLAINRFRQCGARVFRLYLAKAAHIEREFVLGFTCFLLFVSHSPFQRVSRESSFEHFSLIIKRVVAPVLLFEQGTF